MFFMRSRLCQNELSISIRIMLDKKSIYLSIQSLSKYIKAAVITVNNYFRDIKSMLGNCHIVFYSTLVDCTSGSIHIYARLIDGANRQYYSYFVAISLINKNKWQNHSE
jgi:hypothetical protein